ncbi:hypothetical protein [Limosilactobacillus equigenerosi]|uniref:hypothetical protein n=1 Tax=Limosilactobacillus equigenerosi TaxID=417373 RepID=UPI0006D1C366|nr:hypothetical protein [Limosilactobacillus equigenerosi]
MRKAHPHGVQGRRPIASGYKRAQKQKKIDAIRKWLRKRLPKQNKRIRVIYSPVIIKQSAISG